MVQAPCILFIPVSCVRPQVKAAKEKKKKAKEEAKAKERGDKAVVAGGSGEIESKKKKA
jgi:hypothetical protein